MITIAKLKKLLAPTHCRIKNLQWGFHLALVPFFYFLSWPYICATVLVFWCMHGLGSGIGAHRYYCHRTFTTNIVWQWIMSFLFTISCTGSTVGYTLIHLKHHANSDQENDPHNPEPHFWRTWFGMYNQSKLHFGPKIYMRLMKDPVMNFFHQYYFGIIALYAVVLALINPLLLIYMLAMPALLQFHVNGMLIALVHSPRVEKLGGYRTFATGDDSYNLWWLKPITLGEELHHNHHWKPASVTTNLQNTWREFDPLYYIIKYVIRGNIK